MADSDKVKADVIAGNIILAADINTIIDNILEVLPRYGGGLFQRTVAEGTGQEVIYTGFKPRNIRFVGTQLTGSSGAGYGEVAVEATDLFNYANNATIQAVWAESEDAGTITQNTGTGGVASDGFGNLTFTNSAGFATITAASLQQYDLRRLTGADSGVPTRGALVINTKQIAANVTNVTIRLGNDASNYLEVTSAVAATTGSWVPTTILLATGTQTGSVDWENIDYVRIRFTITGTGNVDIDSMFIKNEMGWAVSGSQTTDAKVEEVAYRNFLDSISAAFVGLGTKNIVLNFTLMGGSATENIRFTASN